MGGGADVKQAAAHFERMADWLDLPAPRGHLIMHGLCEVLLVTRSPASDYAYSVLVRCKGGLFNLPSRGAHFRTASRLRPGDRVYVVMRHVAAHVAPDGTPYVEASPYHFERSARTRTKTFIERLRFKLAFRGRGVGSYSDEAEDAK